MITKPWLSWSIEHRLMGKQVCVSKEQYDDGIPQTELSTQIDPVFTLICESR